MSLSKTEVLKKLDKVTEIIPSADVLSFFDNLLEAYKEHQVTKRDIARVNAQKDILLLNIKEKYALYHKVFDRIFEERQQSIDKFFEVIDKGIRDNDKDLLSSGLYSLSKLVSTSPFANINDLRQSMDGNKIIEI